MINSFKNIIWDFDGVLINSNQIREAAFREAFTGYSKKNIAELIKFHKLNEGLSRYVKIEYFFNKILNQKLTKKKSNKILKVYNSICLDKLKDKKLLINETITFIKQLYSTKDFHIASGSDNNELNELFLSLDIGNYFNSINGSPEPKKEIVKRIISENNYNINETCLIGDSINDYEAALQNDIQFFGYNNLKLINIKNINYINSF